MKGEFILGISGMCKNKNTEEEMYFVEHREGGKYKIYVNNDDTGEGDYLIEEKDFKEKFDIVEIDK